MSKSRAKFQKFCRPQLEQLEPRTTPSTDLFTNMVAEMLEHAPELAPSVPYYLSKLRADGAFTDLNYRGSSDASANNLAQAGQRLEAMSLAYKWDDPSNTYFNNPTLKAQILQGWNYIATKGGSVTAPNWWWKAIGVPQGLSDGLVLFRNEMAPTVRGKILSKYFSSVWQPTKMDGANLAYQVPIAMIDGMLRGNASRISSVVSSVTRELSAYSGEGIQRDLSFFQHKPGGKYNFYSGSYGMVFAQGISRTMRWVGDTPYAFSTAAVDQENRYLLDGLAWMTRGDTFDIASQGRSITRQGWPTMEPFLLRNALADMATLGRRTDELLAAVDRYDYGVSDTNFLAGNKAFYSGDSIAHQRQEMLTAVKMLSNRVARPETAAGENKQGFFLGDGFTMFVQDGDEFGSPGNPDIMQVWDWQRLPGTTVEHNGSIPYYDMFKSPTNSLASTNLVGMASDGMYGVAAMDYRRGGVTLTAKKAWFMFDNEVVALGAGISDAGGAPIFTSLNQVFLDGQITVQDAAGRRTIDLGSATTLQGTGWIEHDHLGYVILDSSDRTTVQAQFQRGASGFNLPVFSAWVDHGLAPKSATYAYAVVPGMTADALDAYSQNSPIKILANTPTVQAVQHTGLQQTQIAFYAAGSLQIAEGLTITVDRAANLIVKQFGDQLEITAADPRQSATPLTIKITQPLAGPGVTLLADGQTSQISFALPVAPYLGASATRSFQITGPSATLLAATFSALNTDPLDTPPPDPITTTSNPPIQSPLLLPITLAPQQAPPPNNTPTNTTNINLLTAAALQLRQHHSPDLSALFALSTDAALQSLGF